MTTDYGSPKRHDPTASHEQDVIDAAQEHVRFLEEDAPEILNRPLGSHYIEPSDLLGEYLAMRNDLGTAATPTTPAMPSALAQVYGGMVERSGELKGLLEFVAYVERMETLFERSSGGEE